MPRPSNTEERRAQIVEALLSVMSKKGYAGASIAAVAKEAGLAPGLLHYHFESKHEILIALVARLAAGLEARLADRLARAGEDPRARAHAIVDAFVARSDDADPRAVAAWVLIGSEAVREREVRALYASTLEELMDRFKTEIAAYLRAEGKVTRNGSKIAAGVLSAIEGAYRLAVGAPGLLPEGFAAPMIRRMLDGAVGAEEDV